MNRLIGKSLKLDIQNLIIEQFKSNCQHAILTFSLFILYTKFQGENQQKQIKAIFLYKN